MKIGTRLYVIVAVMAAMMCTLGGVALYFAAELGNRSEQMELASRRAFNGEHLNRLVTAVVMDARGIYASKDVAAAKPFSEGLMASLDKIDALIADWKAIVPESETEAFDKMVARTAEFRQFRSETARLALIDPAQANQQGNNDANRANRKAYQAEIDAVVNTDKASYDATKQELASLTALQFPATLGMIIIAVVFSVAFAIFTTRRHINLPITRLSGTMRSLAEGDLSVDVPYVEQKNEIGQMAGAVQVFKDNAVAIARLNEDERRRMQAQTEHAQVMASFQKDFEHVVEATLEGDFSLRIERSFADTDISRIAGSFNRVMDNISSGLTEAGTVLAALAEADLTVRMRGEYRGAFARLADNTNTVADKLSDIVGRLQKTSFDLKTATGEILSGANDLSERTTKQAATIEETSAAMEQLAQTVLNTADRAADASQNAQVVTVAAEEGGQVMVQANEAMDRITQSSAKISNIIGLIDDIAFQTNLLALNASVEAARAGEAGKGFAVVAVEVRRLAQSAAEASAEVKTLIEQSATEVTSGSKLVAHAASKLDSMLDSVRRNRELLDAIARESKDQSASIAEVVTAVRQMDEMTQHNAALVEETNAAIEQTEAQATELDQIVAVFTISGANSMSQLRTEAASARSTPAAPARGIKAIQQRVKAAAKTYLSRGNTAVKADDWAEF